MTSLDTELFNEFKRLDKLLKESRDTERGVSDYIDDMKEATKARRPAHRRFPRRIPATNSVNRATTRRAASPR